MNASMECVSNQEPRKIDFSSQENYPTKQRKVHWSVELEIIHYFVPLEQSKGSRWKQKVKHFKEKATDLRYKPLLIILDSELIQFFHSGLGFLARKINCRSEKVDFENIRLMSKHWDELFDLYPTRCEKISLNRNVCYELNHEECPEDLHSLYSQKLARKSWVRMARDICREFIAKWYLLR